MQFKKLPFRRMGRRISIASRKEVAELAGVSEATVSRVLNNVGPIKEETKQRVQSAALKLGYTPSSLAQSFARRRSGNLGVVMPYLPKARRFGAIQKCNSFEALIQ